MANLTNLDFVKARIDSKHIVLTLSDAFPWWTDPVLLHLRAWLRKVQADSKGKVQLAYLDTSGPLNTKNGAKGGFESWTEEKQYVDIVEGSNSPFNELLKSTFRINYLYRWFVYGTDLHGASMAYFQCMKEIPAVEEEFTKQGMKWLWGFGAMPLCIQTKDKPVRSLADLKGLKLAGEGPKMYPDLFESIGVEIVPHDITKATAEDHKYLEYMETRRGESDGNISMAEFLSPKSMNGAAVVTHVAFLDFPTAPKDFYLMNLDLWKNLPRDVQQVFENTAEWAQKEVIKVMEGITQEAITYGKSMGVQFTYLSKVEQKKFNDYIEKIAVQKVDELNKMDVPGTKIFQRTREIIEEYEAKKKPLKTWQGFKY